MNPKAQYCTREDQDCKYLEAEFLHYWCGNESCCEMRGTDLPVHYCPYYEPEVEAARSIKWGIRIVKVLTIIVVIWFVVLLCQ